MLLEATETPRFFTVADTARCIGLPEARVRDWQLKKFIAPTLTKGRIQFSRADVVRMFVLGQLQETFGQTAIATSMAQAVPADALERLLALDGARCALNHEAPCVEARVSGRTYHVELDRAAVSALRERMQQTPQ
jgi:hypothetical protein